MKRVFLIGHQISHSLSPAIQHAALQAAGLDWRYELLEVEWPRLPEAIAGLRAEECAGANVTIPHKEAVGQWLDELSATARKIGAVNTIFKQDGKLIGDNTDVVGFLQALRDAGVNPLHARVVILGAGGAARAVAFGLAEAGAHSVVILNRTASRAQALADALRGYFPGLGLGLNQPDALSNADIIVNATPAGNLANVAQSPMPLGSAFPPGAAAVDLVYRPSETRFLRDAAAVGARTVGGLGMLVHQGAAAFRLWTGRQPAVKAMFVVASAPSPALPRRVGEGEGGGGEVRRRDRDVEIFNRG